MSIESDRPQFHFTARENWLNDPNGCVFYHGKYHLFFQHNPNGLQWGNMTWGHAVSPDLVHWKQLADAIIPYGGGTIFSGSAVVDFNNSSGLGEGGRPPLVAAFTHARKPFGQAVAFSNDDGRTWQLYADGKHVVPNQGLDDEERDPKIFWHEATGKWVMVLWVRKSQVRFFTSDDLLRWRHVSDFVGEGFYECPDLFRLPVDGGEQGLKWVLHDAALNYWVGAFDGSAFTPEEGPLQGDFGANFYAAQTWNNTGSRIVQIAWMREGKYPGMPFNQQMSCPCELSLRTTRQGTRLHRTPVAEIEGLRVGCDSVFDKALNPVETLQVGKPWDLFDIEAAVEVPPEASFCIRLYGHEIAYVEGQVQCLGKAAPLSPVDGVVSLRILVDRTSVELFGNGGEVCMSSCFVPGDKDTTVECQAVNGGVRIRSLVAHRLSAALATPGTLHASVELNPPPWDIESLSVAPKVFDAPQCDVQDVKAVFYEGLPWRGRSTRVFAYYGIPKSNAAGGLPAMVLVHGGGGSAFIPWVQLWMSRGYAAIAMDTCGCISGGGYENHPRHEHGGPSGWGGFDQVDEPIKDQWTYHAVADVILAHSLIRSFPEVDREKIGLTGVSWGGYLTCIAAAMDDRFKFAAPVYGCGFLGDNSAWLADFEKMGTDRARRWLSLWDPLAYLPQVRMPMLWVSGTNDFAYPMDSWQKSYRLSSGDRTLCLRVGMLHGHGGPGENPVEIHKMAQSLFTNGVRLARVIGNGRDGRNAWALVENGASIQKAELNYTTDTGKWQDRKWQTLPAAWDAKTGKVSAVLPEATAVYYFNLVDNRDLVVSSEHEDVRIGL